MTAESFAYQGIIDSVRAFIAFNLPISGITYVFYIHFINIAQKRWTKKLFLKLLIPCFVISYFSLPAHLWGMRVYDPPQISGITNILPLWQRLATYFIFGSMCFWALYSCLDAQKCLHNLRMFGYNNSALKHPKNKAKFIDKALSDEEIATRIEEMLIRRSIRRWKIAAWIVIGSTVSFFSILVLGNLLIFFI